LHSGSPTQAGDPGSMLDRFIAVFASSVLVYIGLGLSHVTQKPGNAVSLKFFAKIMGIATVIFNTLICI
jgi:hypothetical protein